jgi:hypothetical protein
VLSAGASTVAWVPLWVLGVQFGVRPALVGVAPVSAHADLGAAVCPWIVGTVSRTLLGQGADLVGLQLERLAAPGEDQRVGSDVPTKMITKLLVPGLPVSETALPQAPTPGLCGRTSWPLGLTAPD